MEIGMGIRNFYGILWKRRIPQLLFYIGLTIELIIVIIDKSSYINPAEGLLFRVTFLLFALKLLGTEYTWKEWSLIVFMEFIALISYRITGKNDIIRIVTFAAACKGIPLKQMIRYAFYVTFAGCVIIVLLAVTGIYGDMSLTADYGRKWNVLYGQSTIETRYALGMGHPNALSCMFLMLLAMGIYGYAERMKWYVYLFMMLINIGVYGLTDSKTSMLVTALLLLASFVMTYCRFFREKIIAYLCGFLVFLLCIGFSVDAAAGALRVYDAWIYYTYCDGVEPEDAHERFLLRADRFMNGRIKSLTDTERNDGTVETWSAFSCPENMDHYFDMGWVKLFYRYGVVPGVLYCIACVALLWQFYRKKDAFGLVVFTVLAVYSLMEAHLFSVYIGRNFLLMMMGSYFFPVDREAERVLSGD
ncbi:MAG: hypothetical protein NC341_04620 [Blautia sp.]|nr:hypothetical protein [Blautia sp.]MCM1200921.1 hypothetical protein [Bacteroides fragilis]